MPPRNPPRKRKLEWTADNILTDPRSPLATADLRGVLTHPLAWISLSIEERREVISLFPDISLILDADTDDARPDFESLINDDAFRTDCAAYVENLARGRHDPQWLRDAWRAHERRKAGDFDDYLIRKFERDWGPLPEHVRFEAGKDKSSSEEAGSASSTSPCLSVSRDDGPRLGVNGRGSIDGNTASVLAPGHTRKRQNPRHVAGVSGMCAAGPDNLDI